MRARFAVAGALLGGVSLITAPRGGAAVGDTVTYTLNSDGPLASLAYYDDTGPFHTLAHQAAPWTFTFKIKEASQTLAVSGVTTGQQVSCQIRVNGTVKDAKSSAGLQSEADCYSW
jgi:hypothetical protein